MQTQNQTSPTDGHSARAVTVQVNRKPVVFHDRHVTGLQIKTTAIAQGVAIQLDFVLYAVGSHGQLKPIGDADRVTLRPGEQFRATAPDDNS